MEMTLTEILKKYKLDEVDKNAGGILTAGLEQWGEEVYRSGNEQLKPPRKDGTHYFYEPSKLVTPKDSEINWQQNKHKFL